MAVQMRNRLAGIGPVVDDQAITIFIEAELAGDVRCFQEKMSEHCVIFWSCFVDARNDFSRNDQDVRWRGGTDVAKGDDQIIFVNDVSGDFAIGDFLKQRLAHGEENSAVLTQENQLSDSVSGNRSDSAQLTAKPGCG